MAEVRFENVVKVYSRGDTPAVADFTLDVRDGEFLVLVGPSGCGKSTSLRMVAGLETPTSGRISIGGRDVTNLPPKDRDIAMVFQNYALYPHMTVAENLSFGPSDTLFQEYTLYSEQHFLTFAYHKKQERNL